MSEFEIKSVGDRSIWKGEAVSIRDAVLKAVASRANLYGADLSRANLSGADLSRANLSGAYLEKIREDVRKVLEATPGEASGLLTSLRDGKVDGSAYQGECACLVGTIANLRGVSYNCIPGLLPDSSRPAERWFLAIRKGDVPATNQVSAISAGWIEEWLREKGVPVPLHVPLVWRGDLDRFAKEFEAASGRKLVPSLKAPYKRTAPKKKAKGRK